MDREVHRHAATGERLLAKTDHVLDVLAPEEKQTAFGVLEISIAREFDDFGSEVVFHLDTHFRFHRVFQFLRIRDAELMHGNPHFCEKRVMVLEDLVKAASFARHMVPLHMRRALQGGGKREIGGSPDISIRVLRGDGNERKCHIALFTQADGGYRALLRVPEEAEKLFHPRPFPTAIRGVLEVGLFHRGRSLGGIREEGRVGNLTLAEAVVERQAHRPHPGKQLDPRQKKPQNHTDHACREISRDEVKKTKAGGQQGESTEFSQRIDPR